MNVIKKCALTVSLLTALALGFAVSASAFTIFIYPDVGATAEATPYTGPALSGTYYVTPLAAGYFDPASGRTTDTIQLKDSANNVLFTNLNMATEFGTVKATDIGTSFFYNSSVSPSTPNNISVNSPGVFLATLSGDLMLSNGILLNAGTIIVALSQYNIPYGDGYVANDYMLAASPTAPTPLPAAVWLLGSGLLGFMGFKRSRKAQLSD